MVLLIHLFLTSFPSLHIHIYTDQADSSVPRLSLELHRNMLKFIIRLREGCKKSNSVYRPSWEGSIALTDRKELSGTVKGHPATYLPQPHNYSSHPGTPRKGKMPPMAHLPLVFNYTMQSLNLAFHTGPLEPGEESWLKQRRHAFPTSVIGIYYSGCLIHISWMMDSSLQWQQCIF